MEPAEKRNAPIWIKLFVAFHVFAITAWTLPLAPKEYRSEGGKPPKTKLDIDTRSVPGFVESAVEYGKYGFLLTNQKYIKDSPLQFYLLSTGFWQFWDMFSPNPASIDQYADAVVHFADGSTRHYQYPRMFTLSLGQKYIKERYRKFFERAGTDDCAMLWPAFGQRIALVCFDDPRNPPTKVDLHRHFMKVAPPGQKQNEAYSDEMYYAHTVDLAALRQAKAGG